MSWDADRSSADYGQRPNVYQNHTPLKKKDEETFWDQLAAIEVDDVTF